MRSIADIRFLLDELDSRPACDFEDQDLEFKVWNTRSVADMVALVVEAAVCMANGGGGTVVLGVANDATGVTAAVRGVPREVDVNRLKQAIYDSTDPKLTPVFEEMIVPYGAGRILLMQVYPGLPPYTDTRGMAKIRIGRDCQPLTGTIRRRVMVETGETDFTAVTVPGDPASHASASAVEQLRTTAIQERAPNDLIRLTDLDLINALGVIRNGALTRAGLLLIGKESSIAEHLPGYVWTHLRMKSDTQYTDRADGRDPLSVAIARLTDRIMADNPIFTVEEGRNHFEYRTYPEIALREAVMNAFCHADFRLSGPIIVKQFPKKLTMSNPGTFIGGVSPANILHHPPVARNPHLVDVLTRLRLVNRSNLGIARMFESLLIEGKEPPIVEELGEAVTLTFLSGILSVPFRRFVSEEFASGRTLSVDHLLVLQHLLRHPEIDVATAGHISQRREGEAREVLSEMEREFEYLERGGGGRSTYWTMRPVLHRRLSAPGHPDRNRRIEREAAKTRVLSVLQQRARRNEPGLTNAEARAITGLDREQIKRLMRDLRDEQQIELSGTGRRAIWAYRGGEWGEHQ